MTFAPAIQHLDETLFRFINTNLGNSFFDFVLIPARDENFWLPFYVLLAAFFVWKFRWRSVFIIGMFLLNVTASDQISSAVIKPAVNRVRPCNDSAFRQEVILRIEHCGAGKSFTSSHAANTFAFAMLMHFLFGKKSRWVTPLTFSWATTVSFAQVYVGVHYPIDIAAGALLGISIATLVYLGFQKLLPRVFSKI